MAADERECEYQYEPETDHAHPHFDAHEWCSDYLDSEGSLNLISLLGRAVQDDNYLDQLANDPIGEMMSTGVTVTWDDLRQLLHIPGALDSEVIASIRLRVVEHLRKNIYHMGGL